MPLTKKSKDVLEEWQRTLKKNYNSVTKHRSIGIIVSFISAFVFYLLSALVGTFFQVDIIIQLFLFVYINIPTVILLVYFFRSSEQLSRENQLRESIYHVRKHIKKVRLKEEHFRTLQISLNRSRKNLQRFIEQSKVITPPIANYELDRLQKEIDIFFNTISEVLFPVDLVFSREHKIELEQRLDYFAQQEEQIDEVEHHLENEERQYMGTFSTFDLEILDQFFKYLGEVLFAPTEPYSIWSYKHPINVIALSQFFNIWNEKISICSNCSKVYKKAKKDIEKYYSELHAKETKRREIYNELLIVVISVLISTGINALFKLFGS